MQPTHSKSVFGFEAFGWSGQKSISFGRLCRDGIVQWVARKLGPPADTLTSETDLTNVQEQIVIVIGYFKKFEVGLRHWVLNPIYRESSTREHGPECSPKSVSRYGSTRERRGLGGRIVAHGDLRKCRCTTILSGICRTQG